MAISYDVVTTALAVGAPARWVDNLLTRFPIPGVDQGGHGVTRRISRDAVRIVGVIRLLCEELRIPLERAVDLAIRAAAGDEGVVVVGEGALTLTVDRTRVTQEIARRLADGVEGAPRRARGRPPRNRAATP